MANPSPSIKRGQQAAVLIWVAALWLVDFLLSDIPILKYAILAMVPAITCILQLLLMYALHYLALWAVQNKHSRLAHRCNRAFFWVTLSSPPDDHKEG